MKLTIETPRHGSITLGQLSRGQKGIDQTIAAMQGILEDAMHSAYVRTAARLMPGPHAIYNVLASHVRFVRDPAGVELLRHPVVMLREMRKARDATAAGDCDDRALLGAALLAHRGYAPVWIVAGATPPERGGRYTHVFFGYLRDPKGETARGNVVPMDPQEGMPPGQWPRVPLIRIYRARFAR